MAIKGYGKIDTSEISKLEKQVRCEFPEDYKTFLSEYNGGQSDGAKVCFEAEDIETGIVLEDLLGINLEEPGLCIAHWFEQTKKELLEGMIVIGHAGEAGLLLLVNQDDLKGVYFWDAAQEYEISTEEECIHKVADSFGQFWEGLYPEREGSF